MREFRQDDGRLPTGGVLSDVAVVGAVAALVLGFLLPLEKYSGMESPELARVVDPDALLVATLLSVAAMVLAAVAIRLSPRGRLFPGVVFILSLLLCGRLSSVYLLTPELIWHQ
ncbi:hypothetical protein GCM10022235_06720 [Kribbella ginsengisoli]|uniref:Uncharacterized protein n=1 Tax=Kribbella ginsengisoli TaxID=363865 RepID=A0ABP6VWV0_9ACTN